MDIRVSKHKHISRWAIWENLICYMKQNKKLLIATKKTINKGRRSKTLSEVKLAKNISKNPQNFLEISPMQNEVLLSHKLQDHANE